MTIEGRSITMIQQNLSRSKWLIIILVLSFTFILVACGPAGSGQMTMSEGEMEHGEMEHGDMLLENISEVVMVNITAAPEGKDGEYLTVAVMDMDGNPVTDALVSLEGNMNHAGMIPVFTDPVTDDAETDGVYQVPFGFTMLGDWIITVSAEMADGSVELQDVNLSVSEETVKVHNMGMEDGKMAPDDQTMEDGADHEAGEGHDEDGADHKNHDEDKADHESHDKDDDSEGHGHERGDDDGEKMMASEEVMAAIEQMNVPSIHAIDKAVSEGTIEDDFAHTLHMFGKALNSVEWPEMVTDKVDAINEAMPELIEKLEAGDAEAAASLATEVHQNAHDLVNLFESHEE
ncbi:FixH family protein [Chloroflexi bacterium TSY]|nr:FixH family protein [Chloroflexi bacterium TSY]